MSQSAFQRKLGVAPSAPVPAPKTLTLQPSQFASSWHLRPADPVLVGLKVPSEREFEGALIEARRIVDGMPIADENRSEAASQAYARTVVARSFCDPQNVNASHPTLPLPDDQIARAFSSKVIEWLFDEVDALHVSQSPAYAEADDDEIMRLVEHLCIDEPFQDIEPARVARIRRYLGLCLTELTS